MMGLGRELCTIARISMALMCLQYAKGYGTTAWEGLTPRYVVIGDLLSHWWYCICGLPETMVPPHVKASSTEMSRSMFEYFVGRWRISIHQR
jgi:hypothetical protein